MTQCEKVLDYMQRFGSITTLQAFNDLGCARLSGRIHDLKAMGYDIETAFVAKKNRLGEICHVAEYRLKEKTD